MHDELFQIWALGLTYSDIINLHTGEEANYPVVSIFYKFFLENVYFFSIENLVLLNFVNVVLILLSAYLLREHLSYTGIVVFLSLLISSEFFIRMIFELRGVGFQIGFSSLFSAFFFLYLLKRRLLSLIYFLIVGLFFAALHPLCGLFVCACSFYLLLESRENLHRFLLVLSFLFPILILIYFSFSAVSENFDDDFFFVEEYFLHIKNTGAYMVPVLISFFLGTIFQVINKKFSVNQCFHYLIPLILTFVVIYAYSLISSPIFQARYFSSFFPYLCLATIFIFKDELETIKPYILFACISSVIFLYGPRAQIPFINYQGLIENTHVQECDQAPLFINHGYIFSGTENIQKNVYEEKHYRILENIYSPKVKRNLTSSLEVFQQIESIRKDFPKCKVLGGTLHKTNLSELQMKDEVESFTGLNLNLEKVLLKPCIDEDCGVIWTIR